MKAKAFSFTHRTKVFADARYGRTVRDLRRTGGVAGWHRGKQTYKRERSGERRSAS